MNLCVKENSNIKWIIIAVVMSILVSNELEDDQKELIGNLLLMAGQIFVILAL
ncbi:MAG: hypothetical protein RSG75_11710 [Cellulosilyticaceae bacterium]